MYHQLRRRGFPDDRIVLMVADDMACDPRNPLPGELYAHEPLTSNLYGEL